MEVSMNDTIASLKRNCSLVALQCVTGRDDATVISAARRAGQRRNCGIRTGQLLVALGLLGVRYDVLPRWELLDPRKFGTRPRSRVWNRWTWDRLTLAAFCRKFPHGTFLLSVLGHFLVVVDGRVHDPNCPSRTRRRKVIEAIEILTVGGRIVGGRS